MVTVNAFGKVERNAARVLDHGGAFKHNAGHVRLASHRRAAGHVPIVNTAGRVILPIAWHILMRARVVYPYAIRTGKKITDCLLSGVRASLECVLKRVIEPGPISDALRLIKSRADPRRDARVRAPPPPPIGLPCSAQVPVHRERRQSLSYWQYKYSMVPAGRGVPVDAS